jgi:hypothetical protein
MTYKFVTESNGRKAQISGRYVKETKSVDNLKKNK